MAARVVPIGSSSRCAAAHVTACSQGSKAIAVLFGDCLVAVATGIRRSRCISGKDLLVSERSPGCDCPLPVQWWIQGGALGAIDPYH